MDRQRTLLQLTQKLSAAIAAQDWKTQAALNTLMVNSLPKLAAQGPWSGAERAALTTLQQMHQEAVRRCQLATDEMAQKLQQLQANREGWVAYALENDYATNGIQA